MIVFENVSQGSTLWKQLRSGKPTASRFSEIMTAGKAASTSQDGYLNDLLAERMLGYPIDGFQSQAMADGNRFEANAVAAFEFQHNVNTRKIGFVLTDDGKIGCSPDRFIDEWEDELLEVKAPGNPAIHVSYMRASTGAMKKYIIQLSGQLWLCEREAVRIISYYPGLPDATFRVTRDEPFIKALATNVREFSDKLEEISADFEKRGWLKAKTDKADEYWNEPGFITEEDAKAVLEERFPEVYKQQAQQQQSRHQ